MDGLDADKRYSFSIDLPVRNEWKNVELLRTSVQNCFAAVFQDVDGSNAISMVTGELLENALKYGRWDLAESAACLFRLRVCGGVSATTVTVQNPVDPADPTLDTMKATLDWINSFSSAEEAYRARLLQIANAEEDLDTSGLGLVRVAYEGNCSLAACIKGGVLTMTAVLER